MKYAKRAHLATVVLSPIAVIPLVNAGHTGGELVYTHGASFAHLPQDHKEAMRKRTILQLHEKGDHDEGHDKDD